MTSPLNEKKILIVDDEPDLREILSVRFEMEGTHVVVAENGKAALECLRREKFDAIVSDMRMPGGNGLELLRTLGQNSDRPAIVLISGFADMPPDEVLAQGASALLTKPFDLDDLINAVCVALKERKE